MIIIETIFIVLVMVFLAFSVRVVAEQQRIAFFRLGRYAGLKGPGVILVVPYMDRDCKIIIGDQGMFMAGKESLWNSRCLLCSRTPFPLARR